MQSQSLKAKVLGKIISSELQISKEALQLLLESKNPVEVCDNLISELKQNKELIILPEHFVKEKTRPPKNITGLIDLEIVANHTHMPPIGDINDISKYFLGRLNQFKKYLQPRLTNLQSIANIKKIANEKISVIGIVSTKQKTPKGNVILELEDMSGTAKAIITKRELMAQADEILHDEVIGVSGSASKGVLFVDDITIPDLPVNRVEKKTKETIYAAFLSDIHLGSKKFLEDKYNSMIDFIRGKSSDIVLWEDQQKFLENLKYIFVAGDLVDGVGIYPGQEKELEITDIYKQYGEIAKSFAKIPENIKIIICPGNHDYVRIAQPQPPIDKDVAPGLYELPNLVSISSPGVVKIKPFENDVSLNVLLYHGTSIDSIVPNVSSLKDGYKHPEKVMLALLKKRHLSPPYESGIVTTGETSSDPLAIPEGIDIFHTGHVHSNGVLAYRGTTLLNSGTWQDITDFQKFLGHEPTPGRMPIINLKTRQVQILAF